MYTKHKHTIYVYPRKGFFVKNSTNDKSVVYLDLPNIKISSTTIRNHIVSNEKDIEDYLPSAVFTYIKHNNLY